MCVCVLEQVRRLANSNVIGGFAGATADAFTLFERLETKLEQHPGAQLLSCSRSWLDAFVLTLPCFCCRATDTCMCRVGQGVEDRKVPSSTRGACVSVHVCVWGRLLVC